MGKGRRRGSIWVGIIVVAVFFVGVTIAVASLGGGPDIPHPVGGDTAACSDCHALGLLPENHRERADGGCRSCHSVRPVDDGVAGPVDDGTDDG